MYAMRSLEDWEDGELSDERQFSHDLMERPMFYYALRFAQLVHMVSPEKAAEIVIDPFDYESTAKAIADWLYSSVASLPIYEVFIEETEHVIEWLARIQVIPDGFEYWNKTSADFMGPNDLFYLMWAMLSVGARDEERAAALYYGGDSEPLVDLDTQPPIPVKWESFYHVYGVPPVELGNVATKLMKLGTKLAAETGIEEFGMLGMVINYVGQGTGNWILDTTMEEVYSASETGFPWSPDNWRWISNEAAAASEYMKTCARIQEVVNQKENWKLLMAGLEEIACDRLLEVWKKMRPESNEPNSKRNNET